ncbi:MULTISPECIES: hypothetical protein [unclassified Mycobacterium]|uniref:hypothetical protein n=1 Tax=unclassified Mycobacterium TaxID=2642494 RepID=UPI000993385F|nr:MULTISPECIES: hypothetical protein [unclassified Mycobacterium]
MNAHLKRRVLTVVVWACLGMSQAPITHADNCSPGDFGAAAGCAPPAATTGGDKAESWPPTSVDWPPDADSDVDSEQWSQRNTASAPIVAPKGALPVTPTPSTGGTTTVPTPIVTPGA